MYAVNIPGKYAVQAQLSYITILFTGIAVGLYWHTVGTYGSSTNTYRQHNSSAILNGLPQVSDESSNHQLVIPPTSIATSSNFNTKTPIIDTVNNFYLALNNGVITGDFREAYKLLSHNHQMQRSYDKLKNDYADTKAVKSLKVDLIYQTDTTAHVLIQTELLIESSGHTFVRPYRVHYNLVLEEGEWHMDSYNVD